MKNIKITEQTSVNELKELLTREHLPTIIETLDGEEFLVNICADNNPPEIVLSITDKRTNLSKHKFATEFIYEVLKMTPMITPLKNGKNKIFIDELNMMNYDLNYPNTNVQEMIQLAIDIMHQKICPDIFKHLPLTKEGTFVPNRKIPIFKNRIYLEGDKEAFRKEELVLCLLTDGNFMMSPCEFDLNQKCDKYTARLCFSHIKGVRKLIPLLTKEEDGSFKVNNICTRGTYLNQNELRVGGIYEEKKGLRFLYLGKTSIFTNEQSINEDSFKRDSDNYTYIQVTEKVQKLIDKNSDINQFIKDYARENLSHGEYNSINCSSRRNPRKFINEIDFPFENVDFSVTNTFNTPRKEWKYAFSLHFDYDNTDLYFAIITNN